MEGRVVAGKYTLERELARGGMGAVWIAYDGHLHRKVALKLMSPDHLASQTARRRFEREAMAIAQLRSPHVVQVFDYGVEDGAPFIVMELLEGEDLEVRLGRVGRMTTAAVASILTQAAKGLAAAHALGIIHRDVKPGNLFLARHDTEETLKILDFGVAALAAGLPVDVHTTRTGRVGTPHYMSPEQVRGSRCVDHRADLWSLGVVAYRALTGRLPFEAEGFGEVLLQICSEAIPPPSRALPELEGEVDRFFERVLSRDPARRFGSVREMAAAFVTLAASERATTAAKILVVDDEPDVALLMKQRFRHQIRKGIYDFVFAADGAAALEQIRLRPDLEIALTDINMPGMDGITFLRHAGEANPQLKVVMVTAYSDMSNIREAMNRGAFDFLVKPIDFRDLEATIVKTLKHARELRRTARSTEENRVLKMFVSADVGERIAAILAADDWHGERVEATVAFLDVWGFTRVMLTASPQQALRTLNANFEIILPEIASRGGVVDRFLGDAVMAVFRGDEHVTRALDACVAARGALANLSARAGDGSPYEHGLSAGVESGAMIVGRTGSKVASRLDFTVLGEAVNTAAHLKAMATRGQILVGEAVRAVAQGRFDMEPLGLCALRGKRDPVPVYDVLRKLESESPRSAVETVPMDTTME